jgi:catechol 2,3-dioxygenase-like lactoylglutathione lyase family enzyme
MAVQRLNRAVLYVPDVQRSAAFYADALGFAGPV